MKLVDVMSASGLSGYAIVALLLFVAAFLMVLVMILAPGSAERMARAARLPLDDDMRSPPGTGSDHG
jgi:cbb3-type cytochrome oxidase subunit 3